VQKPKHKEQKANNQKKTHQKRTQTNKQNNDPHKTQTTTQTHHGDVTGYSLPRRVLHAVKSVRPLWLKTVRVASASSYGASMRLRVRHGLLGDIALTIDFMERTTLGWDIMKQLAKMLRLDSPFQVVLYADSSSVIQSPLRAVQLDTDADEATLCYVVQSLQVPSAQQCQDLMTAIYHKDVMELSYLLGKGLDLTGVTMEGGHTSTLVAHCNGTVTPLEMKSSTLYKLLLRRVLKTRSLTCYSNSLTLQKW